MHSISIAVSWLPYHNRPRSQKVFREYPNPIVPERRISVYSGVGHIPPCSARRILALFEV